MKFYARRSPPVTALPRKLWFSDTPAWCACAHVPFFWRGETVRI